MITSATRLVAVGCALVIAAVVLAGGAVASEPNGAEQEQIQGAHEALDSDLALVASQKGWTIQQTRRYFASARAVGSVSEVVDERDDAIFVGSVLAPEPEGTPSILIKGPAPAWVWDVVSGSEIEIRIQDEQPFSSAELEDQELEVYAAAETLGLSDVVVSASAVEPGLVRVWVGSAAGIDGDDVAQLLAAKVHSGLVLVVSTQASPAVEPEGAFGGMRTHAGGTPYCTSGWTVVIVGASTRGVSTAGHCATSNGINHPGHGIHSATWIDEHLGGWGDVGWFTTAQTEADDFYADAATIRDVASVESAANFSVGEVICGYGRASNDRDCSLAVRDTSIVCGGLNRLVQMNGDTLIGGDSGGGWSFADRAFGGHQGNCGGFDSFTKGAYFDEAIGVSIATS
jgi:hypothetical protein